MAEDIFPAQQPSFMGEWTYSTANTAPPATTQLRLNTSSQANATAIYVHNFTFNGLDASAWLMDMSVGGVIRLEEKNAPARWHTFTISSPPIQQSGYVELKVTWKAGGQNLTTSVMVSVVSSVIRPTGNAMLASVGSAVASIPVSVPVTSPGMYADVGHVDITGQLVTRDFAFPFQGKNFTSPGMTLRQYYAGQAMMGFVAATSGVPTANLIGKLSEYAFRLADNMIVYEKQLPPPSTLVGQNPNPPLPQQPTTASITRLRRSTGKSGF